MSRGGCGVGWGQLGATWLCGVPLVLPSIALQPYRAWLGARKGGPTGSDVLQDPRQLSHPLPAVAHGAKTTPRMLLPFLPPPLLLKSRLCPTPLPAASSPGSAPLPHCLHPRAERAVAELQVLGTGNDGGREENSR